MGSVLFILGRDLVKALQATFYLIPKNRHWCYT